MWKEKYWIKGVDISTVSTYIKVYVAETWRIFM